MRWIGSNTDVEDQKEAEASLTRNLDSIVDTIARAVELRDPYTAGHQRRVATISSAIAAELGMDALSIQGIRTAASIHDIGKIAIPAEILSKPGKLLVEEFELIKHHSQIGYDLVVGLDFPSPVAEMILQHHERIDGSGYPHGLRGNDILLESRIIAVADVVEAMASHRPYRPAHGVDDALEFISSVAGTSLDEASVRACVELVRSSRLQVVTPWEGTSAVPSPVA